MSNLATINAVLISPRFKWVMWSTIAALLLLPLVAMQFSDEVKWGGEDFLFAGALLVGAGALFELGARKIQNARRLVILTCSLAAAVFFIWLEAAVGIF